MRYILYSGILVALSFCTDKVNKQNNHGTISNVQDDVPNYLIETLDTITSQLKYDRLSANTHPLDHPYFEYRVTFIPGRGASSNQGIIFSLSVSDFGYDSVLYHFKGDHFGLAGNTGKFIDTVFASVNIHVPDSIWGNFLDIAKGAYLFDHCTYRSPSGSSYPDRYFVEVFFNDYEGGRPKVKYKLIVKNLLRPGSFMDIFEYGKLLGQFEWKANYH
jgi:hypothetical protein